MKALRAFGGAPLVGDRLVRFAHLDEAGTSRKERFAVVAGVVSHADKQWRALNQYLSDMVDDLVPPEFREGIILHAKDLFHGTKKFHRDRWPRERRMKILEALAVIPVKFDIPIVIGLFEKGRHDWPGHTPTEIDGINYSLAFALCASNVEHCMRNFADEDEVATLISEDVPHMRAHAKEAYKTLRDHKFDWSPYPQMADTVPFERIVEQPMFAAKDESSILQIADLIAFTICRRANGNKDVNCLIKHFTSNITMLPEWFGAALAEDGLEPPH